MNMTDSMKVLLLVCLLALAGCGGGGGGGTGTDAGNVSETGDDGTGGGTNDGAGDGSGTGDGNDTETGGDGTGGGTNDGTGDGSGTGDDTGDGDGIFTSGNPPEFLAIHPFSLTLAVGETTSVTATATHDTGESADVTNLASWVSTDESIVTVTDGVVTGVALGDARIEAHFLGQDWGIWVSVVDGNAGGDGSGDDDGGSSAPDANAGGDQDAMAGETVTLDAGGSHDADNDIASYEWTQTGGAPVSFGTNGAVLTFEVPAVSPGTRYTFRVEVTDTEGQSSSDIAVVTVAAFSGAPIRTNPAGYGPDMVHYVRMGLQRAYLSEGVDQYGDRTIYAVQEDHATFDEIFDPDGLLPEVQITLNGGQADALWGSYTKNAGGGMTAIYSVSAANQPMISHEFGDPMGGSSLFIEAGPVALPDAVYFTARQESPRGGLPTEYPVFKLDGGPTQIGSFDTLPSWLNYRTGEAMYVAIPGELHRIHAGTVTEVTLDGGHSLDMWGWAGYGVTGTGEHAFVVGEPAGEGGLNFRLYKVSGTRATELPSWTDYGTPNLVARLAGINFVSVQSLSRGKDVLVSIDNEGNVEEIVPPTQDADGEPVDYSDAEIRPLHVDNNGAFFSVGGDLYFRNINGWQDLGISTDRIVVLESDGVRHYVMGGARTYLETQFGITLPETEYGIYRVTLDMTSLIPRRELVWEAEFDYAHQPVLLTYHGGNLYFRFDTTSAEWSRTHHIPYGSYTVP